MSPSDIFQSFAVKPFWLVVLLTVFSLPAYAGIETQPWMLNGALDGVASLGGKTTKVKKQAFTNAVATFSGDNRFTLVGDGLNLSGSWQIQKRDIKVKLDKESLSPILDAIKNDLGAQSNLGVTLLLKSAQMTARQNKTGSILDGRVLIKIKLGYPGYTNKSGSLTLDYKFSAQAAM